ncbi:hypothetical protein J2X16_003463 [Pelomonas aquatica]|uniref:Uncharacterized protein n=1 Tax=Pelomonas aquatica TaxID=431058 RepID=A0ABU1ZBW3_9BURK|nr:DUF1780 domain-containing protein [Pelomonas aquatica]MDR7298114.1 hypothetical protein [Pelomonas aquatica]
MPQPENNDPQAAIDVLREAVTFFSGANKALRERWVCEEMLQSVGVEFSRVEITSSVEEPPDVIFRDARFEVKEVLDPGRKRHREYKEALATALSGKTSDVPPSRYAPKDITPAAIADRAEAKLEALVKQYPEAVRSTLDALLYVNLAEHWLVDGPMPPSERFSRYGWRSVSVVYGGRHAFVFYASDAAPGFLRARVGKAFTTAEG